MNFEQFDTVILREPLLGKNVRIGSLGVILDILDEDVFLSNLPIKTAWLMPSKSCKPINC